MIVLAAIAAFLLVVFVIAVQKARSAGIFDGEGWLILAAVSGIAALICGLFPIITYASRAYGRPNCAHWGQQVGVQTKFVILNWADTGTCLARTPDGKWIPSSNWQSFVGGGK